MPGLVQTQIKNRRPSPKNKLFLIDIVYTHKRKKHMIVYHRNNCIDKVSSKRGKS